MNVIALSALFLKYPYTYASFGPLGSFPNTASILFEAVGFRDDVNVPETAVPVIPKLPELIPAVFIPIVNPLLNDVVSVSVLNNIAMEADVDATQPVLPVVLLNPVSTIGALSVYPSTPATLQIVAAPASLRYACTAIGV